MNDDELMRLVLEIDPTTVRIPPGVRKVVDAAIAAEREACAKVCDDEANVANMQAREGGSTMDDGRAIGAEACAAAIRARSNAGIKAAAKTQF